MGFWFQGKKGSEAQEFGNSTKKARKSRLSFMLEEIITPSALIPGGQDTDPLRQFLGSRVFRTYCAKILGECQKSKALT